MQLALHAGSRSLSPAASRLRDVLHETLADELVREGGAVRKKIAASASASSAQSANTSTGFNRIIARFMRADCPLSRGIVLKEPIRDFTLSCVMTAIIFFFLPFPETC